MCIRVDGALDSSKIWTFLPVKWERITNIIGRGERGRGFGNTAKALVGLQDVNTNLIVGL